MMTRQMKNLAATGAIVAAGAAQALAGGGQILWRFEIPSDLPGQHIGVGPDGTVYTTDNLRLYALTPGGDLLWSHPGAGGGRPITFGDDGTIYTSAQGVGIRAVNPDGSLKGEYRLPTDSVLHAGPNVGPDGNLYAVQEIRVGEGVGAFSVDAGGSLRWTNPGNPQIGPADLANNDVVFGDGRLFAATDGPRGHGAATYAFTLDGDQVGYSGLGDWEIPATSFPRMMLDGRIIFRWGQVGLMAVRPDGTVDWQVAHPNNAGTLLEPSVGPDGAIYVGDWLGVQLWSVNPDGSTRWFRGYESGLLLQSLDVSPDNSTVVAAGSPGWVRGYDTATGTPLWQADLPPEQDLNQSPWTIRPAFSADGGTVYLTTRFAGNGVGHSYLYAIQVHDTACAADFNGDGAVNTLDVLTFLNAWSDGDQSADFNADGAVNTLDVLAFLNAWSAGC